MLIEETYKQFVEWCRCVVSACLFISLHSDLENCPIKILHRIRTDMKYDKIDVNTVNNYLKDNKIFVSKVIKSNNKRIGSTIVNKYIIKRIYCDKLIIDDTVGANDKNFQVEVIVSKVPNNHIQLAGFGYLSGKNTEATTQFLTTIKELAEE